MTANCNAANVYGKCTECAKGYKVSKTGTCDKIVVAVPPIVVDNCAVYGYIDAKGKWWARSVEGCRKACKVCKEGYELVDGKCVPC